MLNELEHFPNHPLKTSTSSLGALTRFALRFALGVLAVRLRNDCYMTLKQPIKSPFSNCGKRLFAWMMATCSTAYEEAVAERKQALFSNLHGNVLEIGPGSGPNLSYYPHDIHWIGIEPNPFIHPYLQKEAERLGLSIDLRTGTAERLEAEDNSIDTIVSTLVLCSVPDLPRTLQEILRVLKPGGRFLFLEHVAAPQGTWLRKIQSGIRPIWQVIGDGCHPDRETGSALETAGFETVDYQQFRAPVPVVSPQIVGIATKKAAS
ncbi:MAG: class I SAM-dependent methyltransferase [Chroococcidiopsidaceae cyanobacterium CP_BM_ER_R8_30]|nr:class I SAM-dependent methyltransferase [Chroococcidiopsidaceae cyanobacterium CP_BM_ER_R8_30]